MWKLWRSATSNRRNLDTAHEAFPHARTYRDFRRLYEKVDDIDGVVVSTTEHTHAYATLPALLAKKHVYCEKPLTHNVAEARLITEVAAKAGVATQMGTQMHASPNYHRVVELMIQSNAIGKVSEVHVWVSRAWGLQSEEESEAKQRSCLRRLTSTEAMELPTISIGIFGSGQPRNDRITTSISPVPIGIAGGSLGMEPCPTSAATGTISYWALKLDAPRALKQSAIGSPEIAPASMTANPSMENGETYPPANCTGTKGHITSHALGASHFQVCKRCPVRRRSRNAVSRLHQARLVARRKIQRLQATQAVHSGFTRSTRRMVVGMQDGSPTSSPFSYAGPLTEANHLGNVAFRAGGKILWDAKPCGSPTTKWQTSISLAHPRRLVAQGTVTRIIEGSLLLATRNSSKSRNSLGAMVFINLRAWNSHSFLYELRYRPSRSRRFSFDVPSVMESLVSLITKPLIASPSTVRT